VLALLFCAALPRSQALHPTSHHTTKQYLGGSQKTSNP
jgi:hypothetical protein